jgi:hypothetical protein
MQARPTAQYTFLLLWYKVHGPQTYELQVQELEKLKALYRPEEPIKFLSEHSFNPKEIIVIVTSKQ